MTTTELEHHLEAIKEMRKRYAALRSHSYRSAMLHKLSRLEDVARRIYSEDLYSLTPHMKRTDDEPPHVAR